MSGINFQRFPASSACTMATQTGHSVRTKGKGKKNNFRKEQVLICLKPTASQSIFLMSEVVLCACLLAETSNKRIRIVQQSIDFLRPFRRTTKHKIKKRKTPAEKTDQFQCDFCFCSWLKRPSEEGCSLASYRPSDNFLQQSVFFFHMRTKQK